jgi:hypothetical protein
MRRSRRDQPSRLSSSSFDLESHHHHIDAIVRLRGGFDQSNSNNKGIPPSFTPSGGYIGQQQAFAAAGVFGGDVAESMQQDQALYAGGGVGAGEYGAMYDDGGDGFGVPFGAQQVRGFGV